MSHYRLSGCRLSSLQDYPPRRQHSDCVDSDSWSVVDRGGLPSTGQGVTFDLLFNEGVEEKGLTLMIFSRSDFKTVTLTTAR
ncbi:hypothetical protein J6590_104330, partial [Homalodisca vitripennis]